MTSFASRIALVVLVALVLAACAQQEPEITQQQQVPADQRTDEDEADEPADDVEVAATVELIAGDIFYDNEPSELPVGTTQFVMENEGNLPHDLVLEELGDRQVIEELPGGGSGEGSVTLEAGEFTFYCSVPGHRQAGMEFSVTVG
jgi:uncharacterized cupredoxin-like copper-binding protein